MLNNLTGLTTYIELAKDEKDDVTLRSYLSRMAEISEVPQEELEFTRDCPDLWVRALAWQGVDAIVQQNVPLLPEHQRGLEVYICPAGFEVYADPLLEKVFYNLIDNALRYGGKRMNRIRITSHDENGFIIMTFAENGDDIGAQDKPSLFTKGFGKHTGLGLSLSREILSITGITIRETGTPGECALFEITVPRGDTVIRPCLKREGGNDPVLP